MTRDDLISALSEMAVNEDEYSLNGLRNSDCMCVVDVDSIWKICYVERDKPKELAMFDSVEDAYDFVYRSFSKWRPLSKNKK
jgi:hypothetical protein